jgi:mono/diheme cytochrome c family protein
MSNCSAFVILTGLTVIVASSATLAADVDNGGRLAQQRCAGCHDIKGNRRYEVAQAPPFEAIAKRSGFSAQFIVYSLLEPHPKMNVSLTRREADDIAAYIGTLAR